jgi:cell division septum initiation protein DivIVA
MNPNQQLVDNFVSAVAPFKRLLEAVEALGPVMSREQAVNELDIAVAQKQKELESVLHKVAQANKAASTAYIDAETKAKLVNQNAKDKANEIIENAKRKASAYENKAEDAVAQAAEKVAELEARQREIDAILNAKVKEISDAETKLAEIKGAIARLVSQE